MGKNKDEKGRKWFSQHDPFNPQNVVEGVLYYQRNRKYGGVEIRSVNGKKCEQFIWPTPKMHYPYDRNGVWIRPQFEFIEIFEKLDGTNILAFKYHDVEGNEFVSYKTRLMPFIKEGHGFGDFMTMWNEMLDIYPSIPERVFKTGYNLSFELYGKRNKILLDYKERLAIRLLFGVKEDGVRSPTGLLTGDLPVVKSIKEIRDQNINFAQEYEEVRKYLNEHIHVEKHPRLEEEMITGLEGSIWYLTDRDGFSTQWKCKPDIVQDIHRRWGGGIPPHSIYITVVNAYEQHDKPNFTHVMELLKEEFKECDILKKTGTIHRIMDEVKFERELKSKIVGEYIEHGFDINTDKRTCMRYFGTNYPKKQAARIFHVLWQNFGEEEDESY